MRHVVSADGTKAFWTYVPEGAGEPTQLLAHVDGAETIQLDAKPAKQSGNGPYGNGVFQAASKDGSVVYFTAPGRLTKDSKAEKGKPDLYRYDFAKAPPLSDLTTGTGTVPGDVQGVDRRLRRRLLHLLRRQSRAQRRRRPDRPESD